MKTSADGRKAITQREGNKLTAYLDSVGVLTIGVGHTSAAGDPKVTRGMKITAAESDAILSRDLAQFEAVVNSAVKVPMTQNQFDALVSLAFNIGPGAFRKSSVVRKFNAGNIAGAADAFLLWNKGKVDGKLQVIPGLTKRRQAERAQFLAGKPVQSNPPISAPEQRSDTKTPPARPAEPNPWDSVLHRGSRGQFVEELQENLNVLGYGPIQVDGQFGEQTEAAVVKFQHDHGLKPDGWAGPRTLEAIGKAVKERELEPVIEEAEKTVPPEARQEVKEKTTFGGWLLGLLSSAGAAITGLTGMDWKVVAAIGATGILAVIIVVLMRRQLIAAFKEINQEARS